MPTTVDAAAITPDIGDATPLLDLDTTVGSPTNGQYVIGRNNARDIRVGLLNSVYAPSVNTFTPRPGVLARKRIFGDTDWMDGKVIAQATPSRVVTIKACQAVCLRLGLGVYLLTLEQDLNVTLNPADGTNPRYDLVCLKVYDKGPSPSDPQHGPYVVVVYGDPSGTPAVPSVPTGAIPLAQIYRPAGSAGDQIGAGSATITDRRLSASLHGGVRPLLGGDALGDAGGYHGELRLRSHVAGLGGGRAIDRYDATDGLWHGLTPLSFGVAQTASGVLTTGNSLIVSSLVIPDPGFPYKIRASASVEWSIDTPSAPNQGAGLYVTIDSTAYGTGKLTSGYVLSGSVSANFTQPTAVAGPMTSTTVYTGSRTVRAIIVNHSTTYWYGIVSGGTYSFNVEVIPT